MLLAILALAILSVALQLRGLMKVSELNTRLTVVEKKVDTLLAAQADPEVPADLEATTVRLETKLAAVTPAP